MASLAFIVSGIEQSEESRIYQFRAATPAEVQAADQEGLEVPGRFRFEQVGDSPFFIENGIAIDPYGCVTIPTGTITTVVEGENHGMLQVLVSRPGDDLLYVGEIQLEDYTPENNNEHKNEQKADDPATVPATKVGDMVIFSTDIE